ncbi:MAG: response regulator [Cryobacterium sp.]|nr:response regulator [Oligoflexia bacterium]
MKKANSDHQATSHVTNHGNEVKGVKAGHDTDPSTSKVLCKSILIAEDNEDVRESIADALESEGYHVYTSQNGKDALAILPTLPGPVLVLLDLMMPVMNGWEFLDAQKHDAVLAGHQVVTISAVSPTQSLQDPEPLDTAGSLQKPINLEPLLETVHQFCGPARGLPTLNTTSTKKSSAKSATV